MTVKFDSSVIRFNLSDKQFQQSVWQLLLAGLPNTIYLISPVLLLTISITFLNLSHASAEVIDGIGIADAWIIATNVVVFSSLNTGTSTLAAQAHGSKNFKRVGECLHRALVLRVPILVSGVLLLIWSKEILSYVGASSEVAFNAGIYCRNIILGVIAFAISDTLKAYIIAHNIFLPLLYIQSSLLLVQMMMCQFFISHLSLGLAGAAYAFCGTQLVGLLMIAIYAARCKETEHTLFWPKCSSLKIGELLTQLKQEFWIGMFMYIEWMGYQIIFLLAARMSVKQLQAYIYTTNATCFVYFFPVGVAVTLGPYVAGAMGDGNLAAVKKHVKAGIACGILITLFCCALLFGLPRILLRLYTDDEEVIETSVLLLRTYGCYYFIECEELLLSSVIKAIGKETEGAIIFFFSIFGVGLASAYLLCFRAGLESMGLLIGIAIGVGLMVVFSIYLLKKVDLEELSNMVRMRANHDNKISTEFLSLAPPNDDELEEIKKLRSTTIPISELPYSSFK